MDHSSRSYRDLGPILLFFSHRPTIVLLPLKKVVFACLIGACSRLQCPDIYGVHAAGGRVPVGRLRWQRVDGPARRHIHVVQFGPRRSVLPRLLVEVSQVSPLQPPYSERLLIALSISRNVVSTWSSGTGGAGIIGSISYAGLRAVGISTVNTMLLMLCVPLLEGAAFWILLRNPTCIPKNVSSEKLSAACSSVESQIDVECGNKKAAGVEPFTLADKIRYLPSLLKYMVPLTLVYFFEYFINQGLVS